MADSFGLKIGLEGEKEFKKALADINQSFKVLGSEMKLATSQFDKNDKSVEALAARNKVLRKEIDEQTTKIDTLRKALQNAATSFGKVLKTVGVALGAVAVAASAAAVKLGKEVIRTTSSWSAALTHCSRTPRRRSSGTPPTHAPPPR